MSTSIANLAIQVSVNAGQLTAQVNGVNQQLGQLGNQARASSGGMNMLTSGFGRLGAAAAGYVAASRLIDGAQWAIKLASDAEQAQMAFKVMLGSAEQAKSMIADLRAFAAATPFEFNDLQQASKVLLQFGLDGKEVMPTLQMLGDVSGGNAQKLEALTLAFGQMSAAGRLTGQDLLQFINAGFNPLQEISQRTGISMGELKKQMEAGAISAQMVRDAFASATGEGGRFNGFMDEASQTLAGQFGKLREEIIQSVTEISSQFLPGLKEATAAIVQFLGAADGTPVSESWKMLGDSIGAGVRLTLGGFRQLQGAIVEFQAMAWRVAGDTLSMVGLDIGAQIREQAAIMEQDADKIFEEAKKIFDGTPDGPAKEKKDTTAETEAARERMKQLAEASEKASKKSSEDQERQRKTAREMADENSGPRSLNVGAMARGSAGAISAILAGRRSTEQLNFERQQLANQQRQTVLLTEIEKHLRGTATISQVSLA